MGTSIVLVLSKFVMKYIFVKLQDLEKETEFVFCWASLPKPNHLYLYVDPQRLLIMKSVDARRALISREDGFSGGTTLTFCPYQDNLQNSDKNWSK